MKDRNKKNPTKQKPQISHLMPKKKKFPWTLLIWVILFVVTAFYLFNAFGPEKRIKISYSEFKQQVKKGYVSEIIIKGQEIKGRFKEGYQVLEDPEDQNSTYSLFSTVKPALEDPLLMTLLDENNVKIHAEKSDGSWLTSFLIIALPWVLILGYFAYLRKKMQVQAKNLGPGNLFGVGKSRAKRYTKSMSQVTYDDVAGLANAKKDLEEIVDYLKQPEKFKKLGADIPKGILLVGPPGTGKTLLARATAGEASVPFFSISGSEFIEMFVGVGASRVRDMFQTAKKEAPSIIFIDELDSVGRARGTGLGGGHDEREQTLNQILSEMDGFSPHESVIVLSATNRPDVLDPALTRPGRFDRQVTLDMPQKEARKIILQIHSRKVPLAKDVELEKLAARTVGFSGADLKNLVNEAALLAARQDEKEVSVQDFDLARDKILLGHKREEMMSEEEKKITAYHEAGHALMAKLTPGADPLQKVTIIPRGRSLGATEQIPEEDRHNFTREYLLKRIAIAMGGRSAEKLMFKDISNGAWNDLKQVTKLARRMVTQWGMSEKLGPVTFSVGEEHPFLGRELAKPKDFSEETARIIDQEIQEIVKGMEEKAVNTLRENRDKLKRLAQALMEKETLEDKEIERILEDKSRGKNKKISV
jgi:cell division protease FtsH